MENLCFYQTLTDSLIDDCGLATSEYIFTYPYQNNYYELQQKGSSTIKLIDPLDIWNVESEGLRFEKQVRITYPDLLSGPAGVACEGAELGLCIIWTNKSLKQTGSITPIYDEVVQNERICKFKYTFLPGKISGDLELSLNMYIKNKSNIVLPKEDILINEDGVTVGEIEKIVLDFKSTYMEFPIEERYSETEPLWWVEFADWEDPKTIDMFSEDSFCLFLNPYYESCPVPSTSASENGVKNFDLLVDIISQTYLMIFSKLSEEDLRDTQQNIGLSPDTICSVMHQFIEDCSEDLHWESTEHLLKSLQVNIRKMLQEEA